MKSVLSCAIESCRFPLRVLLPVACLCAQRNLAGLLFNAGMPALSDACTVPHMFGSGFVAPHNRLDVDK